MKYVKWEEREVGWKSTCLRPHFERLASEITSGYQALLFAASVDHSIPVRVAFRDSTRTKGSPLDVRFEDYVDFKQEDDCVASWGTQLRMVRSTPFVSHELRQYLAIFHTTPFPLVLRPNALLSGGPEVRKVEGNVLVVAFDRNNKVEDLDMTDPLHLTEIASRTVHEWPPLKWRYLTYESYHGLVDRPLLTIGPRRGSGLDDGPIALQLPEFISSVLEVFDLRALVSLSGSSRFHRTTCSDEILRRIRVALGRAWSYEDIDALLDALDEDLGIIVGGVARAVVTGIVKTCRAVDILVTGDAEATKKLLLRLGYSKGEELDVFERMKDKVGSVERFKGKGIDFQVVYCTTCDPYRALIWSANTHQLNAISSTHVTCLYPWGTLDGYGLQNWEDQDFSTRHPDLPLTPTNAEWDSACGPRCPVLWRTMGIDANAISLSWRSRPPRRQKIGWQEVYDRGDDYPKIYWPPHSPPSTAYLPVDTSLDKLSFANVCWEQISNAFMWRLYSFCHNLHCAAGPQAPLA